MSLSGVFGVSCSSFLFPTAREKEQREESNASEAQKWSELPKDLVVTIGERLNMETDYIQFRCTCKSWYSFLSKKPYHPTHHFPVLILRHVEDNFGYGYGIFGLANNKLYHLRDLPDHVRKGDLLGSSHGWLVIAPFNWGSTCKNSQSTHIYIYNPFTKAQLGLPPSRYKLQKVILSSTPAAVATTNTSVDRDGDGVTQFSHYIVAIAITNNNGKLVYCRSGDKEWTGFGPNCDHPHFTDVIFHGNKIYALQGIRTVCVFHMDADMQINSSCSIFEPQLERRDEITSAYFDPFDRFRYFYQSYLVESFDDLLMVVRVIERKRVPTPESLFFGHSGKESYYSTICFIVFKLERERWLHVKSIGDQSLFVGCVASFSISSREFLDCRGNCIYFTDGDMNYHDQVKRDYQKGVFSLEDKCIVSSLPLQGCAGSGRPWKLKFRRPPAWLTYIH